MTFLAVLLLSQSTTPKTVLDRYEAYRRANPVISADWKVSHDGKELAQGTMDVDGTKRLRFEVSTSVYKYSLSETELGGIELSPNQLEYDEFPSQAEITAPPARLTGASGFIPMPLLRTRLYDSQIPFKYLGRVVVEGAPTDEVSWQTKVNGATYTFKIAVDAVGRIPLFSREVSIQGGMPRPGQAAMGQRPGGALGQPKSALIVWNISKYRTISQASISAYYTPIPKGYVPYSIPPTTQLRLYVDGSFPSAPWKKGDRTVDFKALPRGKPALILITAPDCLPSEKALADISAIKSSIGSTSLDVVSLARTAADAHGLPYDSTGRAGTAIGETSTPLFVLIDGAGKITNLWTGYDPQDPQRFLKELQRATKTESAAKTK